MTTIAKPVLITFICGVPFLPSHASEILYFSMEEDSGSVFDQVANKEAVPVDFGHLYMAEGPPGFGDAVTIDDNGSWQLSAEDSAGLRNLVNNFTVAAWLYLDSEILDLKSGLNSNLNRFIGDDVGWDRDGWAMGVFNTGQVRFTKNGIIDVDLGGAGTFPLDEWAHFAATVSSENGVTLYVNGEIVGTNENTSDLFNGTGDNGEDDPYAIGRAYGDGEEQWFGGKIDEVRVFDTVLDTGQVQALLVPLRDPALVANNSANFAANGAVTILDIPLSNDGESLDLRVTGASFTGPDAGDFSLATTTPHIIAPGASSNLQVNFTPSNGPGDYETTITVQSNDPQRTNFEVNLTATVRDPWLVIEGGTDLGSLASNPGPVVTMVTVRNSGGTETLEISDVLSTGTNEDLFTINNFPTSIAPGATADIEITFNPGNKEGRLRGELEIESNNSEESVQFVQLDSRVLFADLDSHLVSRFAFDNPDVPGADSGTFGNDAAIFGDVALVGEAEAAIGSGAAIFDGDGDYLEAGDAEDYASLLDDGEGFTVAAWVCPASVNNGPQRIVSTFSTTGGGPAGWECGYTRNAISTLFGTAFSFADYPQTGVPSGPTVDQWSHLAYVFSGAPTRSVEFFVDGVSIATTVASEQNIGIDPDGTLLIGTRDTTTGLFVGKMDDLRIYDAELTVTDIENVIDSDGVAPPLDPPRITSVSLDSGNVTLVWESNPEKVYTIERSFNDTGKSALRDWDEIVTGIPSAGATSTYEDTSLPANLEQAYYRVIERQAPGA